MSNESKKSPQTSSRSAHLRVDGDSALKAKAEATAQAPEVACVAKAPAVAEKLEEKKRRRKWPLIVFAIVLVVLLALGLTQCQSCQPTEDMEPNVTVGPMTDMSEEDLQKMLDEKLEEGMLGFSINSGIIFESPEAKGKILFENPGNNAKLTKVEIFRDDTNEVVYSTGYLEPGSFVEEDQLDTPLQSGSYACTAYVSSYKLESKEFIGKAAVAVTIVVE